MLNLSQVALYWHLMMYGKQAIIFYVIIFNFNILRSVLKAFFEVSVCHPSLFSFSNLYACRGFQMSLLLSLRVIEYSPKRLRSIFCYPSAPKRLQTTNTRFRNNKKRGICLWQSFRLLARPDSVTALCDAVHTRDWIYLSSRSNLKVLTSRTTNLFFLQRSGCL